jgi:prevent-host-death family protein
LRTGLKEVLKRAEYNGRITLITSHGKPVAAVVSADDAALIKQMRADGKTVVSGEDAALLEEIKRVGGDLSAIAERLKGLAASRTAPAGKWVEETRRKPASQATLPDR